MDIIPYVSINPSRLCYYTRAEGYAGGRSHRQVESYSNLSDNDSYGIISSKARNKIKTAIDWMIYLATEKKHFSKKNNSFFKFKLTFVTLTLSSAQIHDDNTIKKELLNHFLIEAKRKWKINRYLWRAESQKNGNIHFHVLTDKFIPWQELKQVWNRIQNKLGYVDRYAMKQRETHKKGFTYRPELSRVWNYYKQKKAYKTGTSEGWQNPNSTDIHSINKIRNLSGYLSKYCAKNDIDKAKAEKNKQIKLELKENKNTPATAYELSKQLKSRIIGGKLWRLSQSLSKLKSAIDLCDSKVESELTMLYRTFANSVKNYDYNTNIYVPISIWSKLATPVLLSIFLAYVKEIPPV